MPRLHSAGHWCSGSCEDKLLFCEVFGCSCQGGVWPFGAWGVWYGKLSFFIENFCSVSKHKSLLSALIPWSCSLFYITKVTVLYVLTQYNSNKTEIVNFRVRRVGWDVWDWGGGERLQIACSPWRPFSQKWSGWVMWSYQWVGGGFLPWEEEKRLSSFLGNSFVTWNAILYLGQALKDPLLCSRAGKLIPWDVWEHSRWTLQHEWFDGHETFFSHFLQCKTYVSEYSDLAIQMMMHMVRSAEGRIYSQFIFLACVANFFGNRKHALQ